MRINVFDRNVEQIIIKSNFFTFIVEQLMLTIKLIFYLLRHFVLDFFLFSFKDTNQAFAQETAHKCSSVFFYLCCNVHSEIRDPLFLLSLLQQLFTEHFYTEYY